LTKWRIPSNSKKKLVSKPPPPTRTLAKVGAKKTPKMGLSRKQLASATRYRDLWIWEKQGQFIFTHDQHYQMIASASVEDAKVRVDESFLLIESAFSEVSSSAASPLTVSIRLKSDEEETAEALAFLDRRGRVRMRSNGRYFVEDVEDAA
jgi:hypothetical protein